jgi:glutathione synthase/RimK-type ligase-like ATP-grasp enzyme
MRVAIVSCEDLPSWEVDDAPLFSAFGERGVEAVRVPWTQLGAGFDAALLRTPWDYADRLAAFLDWAEDFHAHTPLWHPPDVLRWNLDKRYLFELRDAGLPIAPSLLLQSDEGGRLVDALRRWGVERAFLKPVVGASARHTLRFSAVDAPAAAAWMASVGETMILQPYLESVETQGEISAIVIDGEITHGVVKRPVPGDYRVQDDHGGTDAPVPVSDSLRRLTEAAWAAAEDRLGRRLLYGRVDALSLATGEWVLNELEIVEPSLFFRHAPHAAGALADAFLAAVDGGDVRARARRR